MDAPALSAVSPRWRPPTWLAAPLEWPHAVGAWLFGVVGLWSEMLTLLYLCIKYYFVERGKGRALVWHIVKKQILFTSVQGVSLILLIALAMGTLICTSITQVLSQFLAQRSLNELIIFAIMREISPLVVALVVIARSGTAIATELGNMKVNGEVRLLLSMGINIEYYVVFPRLVAMVASMFCLMTYFNVTALAGGFLITRMALKDTINPLEVLMTIGWPEIAVSSVKSVVFGVVTSLVCTYFGLSAQRSFTEVPQVATRGVVNTLLLVFLLDVVISAIAVLALGYPQPQLA